MSTPRRSNRTAARKITKSTAKIAAQDLDGSDDEDLDITMVDSDDDEANEDSEKDGVDNENEESDDEEEDDEDNEDDDEPVVVPAKRKRGNGKKIIEKVPLVREITVTIAVYSAAQMKKSRTSRGSPASEIYILNSDEPWDTLKAQVGVRICSALNPVILDFDNYNMTFTVPRRISDPVKLSSEDHYKHLLTTALGIKTSATARVIVEPKPVANDKENDDAGDNGPKAKNGREKTKKRDILPGNVALNEKIGLLRDKWRCPTPGGPCGSEHCFVHPTDPEHFPLAHAHMESWAAAWRNRSQREFGSSWLELLELDRAQLYCKMYYYNLMVFNGIIVARATRSKGARAQSPLDPTPRSSIFTARANSLLE
ncbi:hypothetical protein B0H16DRAFT_1885383 [Mycena metata]|uniref:Uncharacterized protein n=1 Tax=Mycena metata TaxID=1033252 RepID=A0AAD7J8I2_9AGAR|nr:hypothetical protein B0H16DRAFT_1885383 [Mycena metata]